MIGALRHVVRIICSVSLYAPLLCILFCCVFIVVLSVKRAFGAVKRALLGAKENGRGSAISGLK